MHLRSMTRTWMATAAFAKPGDGFAADTSDAPDDAIEVVGNNDDASDDGSQPVARAATGDDDNAGDYVGDDDDAGDTQRAAPAARAAPKAAAAAQRDPPSADPEIEWRDKELTRRLRRAQELADQNARLQRERDELLAASRTAALETGDGTQQPTQPRTAQQFSEADFDAAVEARAQHKIFVDNVASAYYKGQQEFGADFDAGLRRLGEMGMNDQHIMRIMATDNPAQVMNDLGKNPGEFIRISNLSPERQMVELAKMSLTPAAQAQPQRRVSRAAPPVDPLTARGSAPDVRYSDDVTDEEWHANEDRKEREQWEAKRSRGL